MNVTKKSYNKDPAAGRLYPNIWDLITFVLVIVLLGLLGWGASQMTTPYHLGEPIPISLSPVHLPYYALRSVLRLLIALGCSLIFTFTVATWAAKSRRAERIIIPMIDVLQSVPVLGFLTITIAAFIALFPGSLLGPECAAIFAVFTSQVWNMALSFYQSLKTLPEELNEAARMFHLNAWQKFWRIEVPFAMPGLLWNTMMSMSASWFFVVACEAISVANQTIRLPGIGSYIALAIDKANMHAVGYAILTMFIVILLYDQLLFRPLVSWADKFKMEQFATEGKKNAWVLTLFQRTRVLRQFGEGLARLWSGFVNLKLYRRKVSAVKRIRIPTNRRLFRWVIDSFILAIILITLALLIRFIVISVTWADVFHVLWLGIITGLRVIVLIALSSLIWVPVGVWVGLRPNVARFIQPIVQFLAAIPANLFFPLVVVLIITYKLNVNIWTSPLMILGTQWYILFNVIAGTAALPKDLHQAGSLLHLRGWLWWKKLILPAIFPFFLTGAITAAGGAWNASIIAEVVSWGTHTLIATGLGAYIDQFSAIGNFPHLVLGIVAMCFYVLLINHILWRPLYRFAEQRFQIS